MNRVHLQKAFFGKDNCLKITLSEKIDEENKFNNEMECYFEFGLPKTNNTNNNINTKIDTSTQNGTSRQPGHFVRFI
jgi:hypothetical protein